MAAETLTADDLKEGDVIVWNGTSYTVVAVIGGKVWVFNPSTGGDLILGNLQGFTKKEPIFEVGRTYVRTDEPGITYHVVIVDGEEVLVWWTSVTGWRLAAWIKRAERKYFEEVK